MPRRTPGDSWPRIRTGGNSGPSGLTDQDRRRPQSAAAGCGSWPAGPACRRAYGRHRWIDHRRARRRADRGRDRPAGRGIRVQRHAPRTPVDDAVTPAAGYRPLPFRTADCRQPRRPAARSRRAALPAQRTTGIRVGRCLRPTVRRSPRATRSPPGTGPEPIPRARTGNRAAPGKVTRTDASADDPDVLRLGSLLALPDVELDLLPFLKTPVAATGDRAEMYENIRTALDGNEAVALVAVEPLHRALRHLDLLRLGASACHHGESLPLPQVLWPACHPARGARTPARTPGGPPGVPSRQNNPTGP